MEITSEEKNKLRILAEKYGLKFIIAHGSYATGKICKGSDLDIAVLGKDPPTFETFWKIHDDIKMIICEDIKCRLNLQALHNIDPLFRYIIMRDSKFLVGDHSAYVEFYCYAFRDFDLHRELFELQKTMMNKRIKLLNKFLLDVTYA